MPLFYVVPKECIISRGTTTPSTTGLGERYFSWWTGIPGSRGASPYYEAPHSLPATLTATLQGLPTFGDCLLGLGIGGCAGCCLNCTWVPVWEA
jgi:hypothetical protein